MSVRKSECEKPVEEIDSPCVRNCCLDKQDICMGCFRSLAEIIQWTSVDKETRERVLKNCQERKSQQIGNIVNSKS